jgi:ribose-phosphate pyrophosphokinase
VDDNVDTGGTLAKAATALSNEGAEVVHAYITHGVLSKNGARTMEKSALATLAITDSIHNETNSVVKVISIAGMFAEAIRRVHHDESISVLFE